MHILSLVTDNNPSWMKGARRMTVEIISWSISTKVWDRAEIELATPGSAVSFASVTRHVTRFVQNKFLISFYNKVFLSILTAFPTPLTNHAVFIWCVKCKTTTVCKRISLFRGVGGGGYFSKTFSIFYMLNSKNPSFQLVLVQWENSFWG